MRKLYCYIGALIVDFVNCCHVNSCTVSAIVLGKLTISPPGPVSVDVGTTVIIDCSTAEQLLLPNIRWFGPFVSSSYRIKDILAHNATVVPYGEGGIGYKWADQTVLQLVVSSAVKQDSGTYWCLLDEQECLSVELVVTNLPRQQNISGWHLFCSYLVAVIYNYGLNQSTKFI